jgi:TetR/AcrR family transcriptional regulator, fatty acid metabolism regulator protein
MTLKNVRSLVPTAPAQPDALQETLAEKQVHLIRQAYRLIGSKGMHRTTLQDVADAAGVSKAVIIYYFKTKENLVLTTMRWVLAQVAARVNAAIVAADAPEEKVRAMIDAIFVDARRNRDFYLAYTDLIANSARNDRFNELSLTFRSIVNGQYADLIRAGVNGGAFEVANVDEAAIGVRGLLDGIFLQWLEEEDWRGLHDAYKGICTRAVLAYLGARAG